MSKQVDERVVSMKFDNSNFEKNINQTMKSIENLKKNLTLDSTSKSLSKSIDSSIKSLTELQNNLKLEGATKGLENVGKAANNVKFDGINNALIETHSKFDALNEIAIQFTRTITDKVTNALYGMVTAIPSTFIQSIKDGFQEYELQINSVQTIMGNTGRNVQDVNAALDELNEYADLTIYNFADMTKNAGMFTAAGLGLEDTMVALKGVGNWAAYAGAGTQDMSRATFQLGQALAAGSIRLQDWMSIEHTAGMAGKKYQEAFMETAKAYGINVEEMIEANGSFRETLRNGWLTADVFLETMQRFAADESMTDAATKVKTFSQLIDTTKEALGTGWASTFRIIVGDFEEAKELWTGVSDVVTGFIGTMSDARNAMLKSIFSSKWDDFNLKLKEVGITTEDFGSKLQDVAKENNYDVDSMIDKYGSLEKAIEKEAISTDVVIKTLRKMADAQDATASSTEDMTDKLEYFQKVVWDVWMGDYKNGEERIEALTQAGYDYYKVQDLVNKTIDDYTVSIEDLTDAQLENIGYTEEEIAEIRALADEAEKAGTPISELIASLSKPSGRTLLLEGIQNALRPIQQILEAIKEAWSDVFSGVDTDKIYNIIKSFNEWSKSLEISEGTIENLKDTLRGLFTILDLIRIVISGGLSITFRILNMVISAVGKALGYMNVGILDVTGAIGRVIYALREWIKENNIIGESIDFIVGNLVRLGLKLVEFGKHIYNLEKTQTILNNIKNAFNEFKDKILELTEGSREKIKEFIDYIKSLDSFSFENIIKAVRKLRETIISLFSNIDLSKQFKNISEKIKEGFQNGLFNGSSGILSKVKEFFAKVITVVKELFGIHSPSTAFQEIGEYVIEGFVHGIKLSSGQAIDAIKNGFFEKVLDAVKTFSIDLYNFLKNISVNIVTKVKDVLLYASSHITETVVAILAVKFIKDISNLTKGLSKFFDGLGTLAENAAGVVKSVEKVFNSITSTIRTFQNNLRKNANANLLRSVAISIGILTASLIALAIANERYNLHSALEILGVLAAILAGLMGVMLLINKFSKTTETIGKALTMGSLIGIALVLLAFCLIIKQIGSMDMTSAIQGVGAIVILAGLMVAIIQTIGNLKINNKKISAIGLALLEIALAIGILSFIVKLLGGMDLASLAKGVIAVSYLSGIMMLLMFVSSKTQSFSKKIGKNMIEIAAAIGIMSLAVKILGGMNPNELWQGMACVAIFAVIIELLTLGVSKASKVTTSLGTTFLGIAACILAMGLVVRLLGSMDLASLAKGIIAVGLLALIVDYLVWSVSNFGGDKSPKVALTLLAIAVAIGILAGISVLLGMMDISTLAKGIIAVGILSLIMDGLMYCSQFAEKNIKQTVALIAAVAALGLITYLLSQIEPGKLYGAVAALGILMGLFSLMQYTSSFASGIGLATIIVLTAVVAALAFIVYQLSQIDAESALASAGSLSLLLLTMSAAMIIAGAAKEYAFVAAIGLAAMSLVVGLLAIIIWNLREMDPDTAIGITEALSLLLLTMSVSLMLASMTGSLALEAAIAMIALSLAVGLIANVLLAFSEIENPEGLIPVAEALSILLLAMAVVLDLCVVAGIAAPAAIIGVGVLMGFIYAFYEFMKFLGSTFTPEAMENVNNAIQIMNKIGQGIGEFVGNIIGGVLSGIANGVGDSLVTLGNSLSEFMNAIQPFITGLNSIDDNTLESVRRLTAIMALITGGSLLAEIGTFLGVGIGMASFAGELLLLGGAILGFAMELRPISEDDIKKADVAISIAEKVNDLANKLPKQGLWQQIFGGQDLSSFSMNLISLGASLLGFAASVKPISEEDVGKMSILVDLVDRISQVAKSIPTNGEWQTTFGGQDLSVFGTQLNSFTAQIEQICRNIAFLTEEDCARLIVLADITERMSQVANSIPANGAGSQQNIGEFGNQMVTFTENMAEAVKNLKGVDVGTLEVLNEIANTAEAFAHVSLSIPTTGWWQTIFGQQDIGEFGKQLSSFAAAMVTATKETVKLTPEGVESLALLNASAESIQKLAELNEIVPETSWIARNITGEHDLGEFGTKIAEFASGIAQIGTESVNIGDTTVTQIDLLASMNDNIIKLADAIEKISSKDYNIDQEKITNIVEGIMTYVSEMKKLALSISMDDIPKIQVVSDMLNSLATIVSSTETSFTDKALNYNPLTKFTEGLKSFSKVIKEVVDEAKDISDDDVKILRRIEPCLEVIKEICEMTPELPDTSVFAKTFDERNIGEFGNQVSAFCSAMNSALSQENQIPSNADELLERVRMCIPAISAIATEVKNSEPLNTFLNYYNATVMYAVANAIMDLANNTSAIFSNFPENITDENIQKLSSLASVYDAFAQFFATTKQNEKVFKDTEKLENLLTDVTSLISNLITRFKTLAAETSETIDFTNLDAVRNEIDSYYACLTQFNGFDPSGTTNFANSIDTIVNAIKDLPTIIDENKGTISEKIKSLTSDIVNSIKEGLGIGAEGGDEMYNIGTQMVNSLSDGIKDAKVNSVNEVFYVGEDTINSFLESLGATKGRYHSTTTYNIGSELIISFTDGITDNKNKPVNTIKSIIENVLSAIEEKMAMFKQKGQDIVIDIANGMNERKDILANTLRGILSYAASNTGDIATTFEAMGSNIVNGMIIGVNKQEQTLYNKLESLSNTASDVTNKALEIKSPSRVFMKTGEYVVEGFIKGITNEENNLYKTAENMANISVDGAMYAAERINDSLNGNFVSNPKISPVLNMDGLSSERYRLNTDLNVSFVKPMSSLSSIMELTQNRIDASNKELSNSIEDMKTEIIDALNNMNNKETALYVDSKKLASSIVKPINRELNILSKRGAY